MVDVSTARMLLRHEQKRWATGIAVDPSTATPLERAEERAEIRRANARRDGDFVYDGVFKYAADTEVERWRRTLDLIHRVDPGPNEDGVYLEFLARQAASCEMTIRSMGILEDDSVLDGVLLGTSGQPRSEAFTSSTKRSRTPVIALSAGMVYLMYQAAKAVVLSWRVNPPASGSAISFSSRIEDTRAVLDADDHAVDQLTDTLIAWFTDGVPRPRDSSAPPPEYHPPLTLFANFAERFVIAHEYGHALYDQIGLTPPPWLPPTVSGAIDKELRADLFATAVIVAGSSAIDRMAPNMTLQGAMLAMKVHEIADDAIGIMTGAEADHDSPAASHPPFEARSRLVFEAYRRMLDDESDDMLSPEALLVPAETADELWRRGRDRLVAVKASNRPLHAIWTSNP